MTEGLMFFFSTLQYAITPVLQGQAFQDFLAIFKFLFYWL
jgi:hypothetical protein